ncbi:MAG TPA: POTRA domain-containing protein, partial [Bdellovibrionales bacterium]|nr:POTRA domain-containing protein [Bdellovibrionales bacterium]
MKPQLLTLVRIVFLWVFLSTSLGLGHAILFVTEAYAQTGPAKRPTRRTQAPRRAAPKRNTRAQPAARPAAAAPVLSGAVTKINVAGNKKIEADAIRARIKTKAGGALDADQIREDVQSIFRMGYFYDVAVDRSGTELTFKVVEKPSVAEIKYEGNDEVNDDDLAEATGLKPYEILDMNKIREATEKMAKLYEDKGYFLARITHEIKDLQPGETVELRFNIEENDKVKVKKITFLGNRHLQDGALKSRMGTQEGGFFSFLSGSGSYKQETFDRDVQLLQYLYFNEGYVQVKVDRPQVYVTPDKKSVYITIRVEEGDQFSVGQVDFAGDLLFTKEELFEGTEILH